MALATSASDTRTYAQRDRAVRGHIARPRSIRKGRALRKVSSSKFQQMLTAQRAYANALRGRKVDLVIGPAFLRGIRRSGYLNSATALYELIDNSIEARARSIHVVLGFAESLAKPAAVAVIDDGHGMEPAMLRLAPTWGGTHRENSRKGFGRFGYGLPTACMSQGRRFSVYSKTPGGRLHRVALDLDSLADGTLASGTSPISRPVAAKLPEWIEHYLRTSRSRLLDRSGHGTVVVIERLDNISWKTAVAFERNLQRAVGVTYRKSLETARIYVQGERVRPIDPLFLTPRALYYDLDDDRAESVAWPAIEVRSGATVSSIKVRAAYFPPTFARIDKVKDAAGLNANDRFAVMRENNGIIVMRHGRQVDVVSTGLWTRVQNNDRYWAVELDFPPELDEWFAITTNKQQVTLTEPLREALRKGGLPQLIELLRTRYKKARQRLDGEKIGAALPKPDSISSTNRVSLLPVANVEGAPFYLVRESAGAVLNVTHPFAKQLAQTNGVVADGRAAELILSVLANSELQADAERKRFYREERRKWSMALGALAEEADRRS